MGACAPDGDAELLAVHGVGPVWIEPGVEVWVSGQGFPVGRSPQVRFEGRLHRPGGGTRPVDVHTRGRVVSPERITVTASSDLVEAVGGRGTFEGRVRVALEGAPGFGTLSGATREVSLDIAPVGKRALRNEMARARQARAWLRDVGLTLDQDDGPEGLTVAHVASGGPAEQGGLRAGDTLVWADGVRLRSLGDLGGPPVEGARRLRVARPGVPGMLERAVGVPSSPGRGLAGMGGWMVALLLLVAWLGPLGRALDAAAGSLGRALGRGGRPRLAHGVGPAVAAAAAWAMAWSAPGHAWLVWAAYVAADLVTQRHSTVGSRLREGIGPLATAGAVLVASLCAEMSPSSVPSPSLAGMVTAVHPLQLLAAMAAAACVYRRPSVAGHGYGQAVAHGLGAAWLIQLVMPAWLSAPMWLAPVLAAPLAALGSTVARRPRGPVRGGRWVAPVLVGVSCPLLAFGWLLLDVPEALSNVLTAGLVAVGLSVFVVGLVRGLHLRIRTPPPAPAPRLLRVP